LESKRDSPNWVFFSSFVHKLYSQEPISRNPGGDCNLCQLLSIITQEREKERAQNIAHIIIIITPWDVTIWLKEGTVEIWLL